MTDSYYAQHGEDQLIEKIIKRLPPTLKPWCVEFGAWDGQHLSNTHYFIKHQEWHGVLIEGNALRFNDLKQTYAQNPHCHLIQQYVGWAGENALDSILAKTNIPLEFDVLSIDIDGNDYHVWEALKEYRPKLVVIEYNSSIPNDLVFIQEANPQINQGNSLLALTQLAESKGYTLYHTTFCNAVYVRNDLMHYLPEAPSTNSILQKSYSKAPRLFQLYDGTLVLSEPFKFRWRKKEVNPYDLQIFPKEERVYGFTPSPKTKWVKFKNKILRHLIQRLNRLISV
ncbi:MAG: hypothetical protein ACR2IL_07510 [Chitinophagaceae bacterium]